MRLPLITSVLLAIVSAMAGAGSPPSPARAGDAFKGTIVDVYSGDEMFLRESKSHFRQFLLEGLDAPELAQPGGSQAKRFLQRLVTGKNVTAFVTRVDQHKVPRVRLYVDDTDVNFELLANGYAWLKANGATPSEYVEAERYARDRRAGVWATPGAEAPWDYRKRTRTGRKLQD